jgi:hypothetical protein
MKVINEMERNWMVSDKCNIKDVERNTVHSEYRFDISLKERKKNTKTLVSVATLQVDIHTRDLPKYEAGELNTGLQKCPCFKT